MRRYSIIALTFGSLLLVAANAPQATDPRALVEKAAEAHGGLANLEKHPAGTIAVKGAYLLRGQEIPFTGRSVYQLPDRIKSSMDLVLPGGQQSIVQILNGNQAAMYVAGIAQQVSDAQLQEMRLSAYCRNVCRLAPLLKDSKFTLASAGEKTQDGRKLLGVRVSHPGQKDVTLYFDAETHLLAALERPGFDANGKSVEQQDQYSDYRTAGGLKYAGKTRITQFGKPVLQSEVTEFTPLERVEPRELAIGP